MGTQCIADSANYANNYGNYYSGKYSINGDNSSLIAESLGVLNQNKKTAKTEDMFGTLAKTTKTEDVFGTLAKTAKTEDVFGTLAKTTAQEERAVGAVLKNVSKAQRETSFLQSTRGAAYANDVGEGLKPAIGEALSKRFWYPALAYIGCSVVDKTLHDDDGNKDFSAKRGGKELAFQTLASLVGPILLVNIGQNTIGKGLSKCGNIVGTIKNGKNPFQNVTVKSLARGTCSTTKNIGKGIINSFIDLPNCIFSTVKMFCKDVAHPVKTTKKVASMLKHLSQSSTNIPNKTKQAISAFKQNKFGSILGKNGIIFGTKGLLGENGILFGSKSSKVIGGLLAILLLYKAVDKAAEKIVNLPETFRNKNTQTV